VKKLAELFGVSRQSIYAWLRLLRDAGIISREYVDVPGRSSVKVWEFHDVVYKSVKPRGLQRN